MRKWQQENRDKVCGYSRKYYNLNKEKEKVRCVKGNLNRYRKYRLDAIVFYGGDPPKCLCCGETEYRFLTIEHKKNNGGIHRKEMKQKYYWGIYEYLKRNNYPEGFSVLCYNCNSAKGHYGVCPHEEFNNEEKGYSSSLTQILPSEKGESVAA